MYPDSIKRVIDSFKLLPGVGEKTAERMAFSILEMDQENIETFSNSVLDLKKNIRHCEICNVLTDNEVCDICQKDLRNKKVLCIVDNSKSVFLFEKMNIYDGLYYVLDGLISPIDGITPDDIGLEKLINRIKSGKFDEIIVALTPSIEGETTALYIKKILEDMEIKISKMANGIPMGADIEYLDIMTLERAFQDRTSL